MKQAITITCAILALALSLCLAACNQPPTDTYNTDTPSRAISAEQSEESKTSAVPAEPIVWGEQAAEAISAIKAVIRNEKEFLQVYDGKKIFLKDFALDEFMSPNESGEYVYSYYLESPPEKQEFHQFSAIDMDNDDIPEVILEEKGRGTRLMFHYEDGVVYGFTFNFRGMKWIKPDGTYSGSDSASNSEVRKINFSKKRVFHTELAYAYGMDNTFRINGKDVTQEELGKYMENQHEKEDAPWYDYTDANIENNF